MRMFTGSSILKHYARYGADYLAHWGYIGEPTSDNRSKINSAVKLGLPWCLDNGAFKAFDEPAFMRMLTHHQGLPGCVFVVAPDVVGDAEQTLIQFDQWQRIIHEMGYPVALAAQDGLENYPIPWDCFECLFIGGSTTWKLSLAAAGLVAQAKARGKHVHMGRVNGNRRIRYAQSIGCDSADGTGYSIDPSRIGEAMPALKSEQLTLWSFNTC